MSRKITESSAVAVMFFLPLRPLCAQAPGRRYAHRLRRPKADDPVITGAEGCKPCFHARRRLLDARFHGRGEELHPHIPAEIIRGGIATSTVASEHDAGIAQVLVAV